MFRTNINVRVLPNANTADLGKLQNAGPGPFSAAGRCLDLHDLPDETHGKNFLSRIKCSVQSSTGYRSRKLG